MSDVDRSDEMPQLLEPPMPLEETQPELLPFRGLPIHKHGPGEYCFFCPCNDCCMFYGKGLLKKSAKPKQPSQPRHGDMGLVNSMRAAAAKREEDRQDKLSAEREGTAGAAEAPKREKSSNDQAKKKTLRMSMKRRRL